MAFERRQPHRNFDLRDLGILDEPAPRGVRTLVEICAEALRVSSAALFVFNDLEEELFVSASIGFDEKSAAYTRLPFSGSAAFQVRPRKEPLRIDDMRVLPHNMLLEHHSFGVRSYLGAVVQGPANEPLAVLAAMHRQCRSWSDADADRIDDLSYLLSQQIMLKASFETLRIMSAERKRLTVV